MKTNRPPENSKEYNDFLDTYKTDNNLPYYLYSGQTDTRKDDVSWTDPKACKDLKQIAPTGSIYLRHPKTEMLCRVTDNPKLPGFIINIKDENGTPCEVHVYVNAQTNQLTVCSSNATNQRLEQHVYQRFPMPFEIQPDDSK